MKAPLKSRRKFGARCRPVRLAPYFNFPRGTLKDEWWRQLAERIGQYPAGKQKSWGIPFQMAAKDARPRLILVSRGSDPVTIPLNAKATYLCFLHEWPQIPETVRRDAPEEGLVVAEYELTYADGARHTQPVRGRFEVAMIESPGPLWLARPFNMWQVLNPVQPPAGMPWGQAQMGVHNPTGFPFVYALPNPQPGKKIRALTIHGRQASPLLVAGLTLYNGASHPLRHLPRRTYRLSRAAQVALRVEKAEVDLGGVARFAGTTGARDAQWLASPYAGLGGAAEPARAAEDLVELFAAEDATLSVKLKGRRKPLEFSIGETFQHGRSSSGPARLEVLGRRRQWLRVVVKDESTGKPAPVRIHFSGSRGEYIAPYGHHAQINANWFEDYGADVIAGGMNFAYVPGEFTTDLPVGELYVEIYKGFEYEPLRRRVTVQAGQKTLELTVRRWKDLRRRGWVTADTHVHFISPHSAWLQAQAEGVNVVNLLASQWGRLFTNVGDITGRPGVVENDTIVYVGTENRNHMLGHMSLLGTKGLPVYPMCAGGPDEAWVGDPDFVSLAEWALENRRKGGVVIRPHYPYCGHTEDPVPIIKGLVDALEININRDQGFPVQEWYRYLNCGYRVAVAGGTDKMGAYCPLGWMRTYAQLDRKRPFSYAAWAAAVRAGRTVSTTGPLLDLQVEGKGIGANINLPRRGGTLEVEALAESFWPLGSLDLVHNGRVVETARAAGGAKMLRLNTKVAALSSGWLAARCYGLPGHPASYLAAHTSPVYLKCGSTRLFDGPAAQHMLALVEGGIEYLNTLACVYDESSRRRMVKLFSEVQRELQGRLFPAAHPRACSPQ